MMKKRTLAAVLATLTLTGTVLSACDNTGTESDTDAGTQNTTNTEKELNEMDAKNPILYLSPNAENGNGTESAPFGTVEAAMEQVKVLAANGAEHITLKFAAGEYQMTQTLELLGSELGDQVSIDFICEDEEQAILSAWTSVGNFTETEVNGVKAWVADMPVINGETLYSHQFFSADGERLERPRYPEEGYLRAAAHVDNDYQPMEFKNLEYADSTVPKDAFYFTVGDIPEISRLSDVQMCMFHRWDDERLTAKSIDYENGLMSFTTGTWMTFMDDDGENGGRYYLDNVYEALNSPGEVYNDRESGKLYYIPKEGEVIDGFTLRASSFDTLLTIEGMHGSEEQSVLRFQNIGFMGSDWNNVERYSVQAANEIAGAVRLNDASYLSFTDCGFDHIGNYAVEVITSVHHVTFDHCTVTDVGAGGIRIQGVNPDPVTEEVPHDITVTDCTIAHYGRVFRNAVGVFIKYAYDCTISHNDIYDGYYTAISIGWSWGYEPHATKNLLIEKNHIYNIGQGLLSDMGGVYSLGLQPGTVIRGNLIHDVQMYENGYGGWGLYTDEGSSDILLENNIVYNVSAQAYHHHYGANNIVRNNILAFGTEGCVRISREEDHVSFYLERNILVNNYTQIYRDSEDMSFVDDSNLMWDYTLLDGVLSGVDCADHTEAWIENRKVPNQEKLRKNGYYNNAVIADPLFADPFNGDFTLAENSPAYDIGFEPIDMSDVGVRD